jgi:hypothetical protein
MKRLLVAGAVSLGLVLGAAVVVPSPASGSDPVTTLQRQVRVLKAQVGVLRNQVSTLQGDVRWLNCDVQKAEFYDSSDPVTFSDGAVGYPMYLDLTAEAAC